MSVINNFILSFFAGEYKDFLYGDPNIEEIFYAVT
jgi:hypothetical protein